MGKLRCAGTPTDSLQETGNKTHMDNFSANNPSHQHSAIVIVSSQAPVHPELLVGIFKATRGLS